MGPDYSRLPNADAPVDILIELSTPSRDANLYRLPEDHDTNVLRELPHLLFDQRNLPIAPHLPNHIYALVRATKREPRLHYYGFGGSCLLVSQSFRELLESFPSIEAEWIPVTAYAAKAWDGYRLKGFNRRIEEPYWLLNVRNRYDIIDRERSVGHWINIDDDPALALPHSERLTPQFKGEEIALKLVPQDPMFQIDGLYGVGGRTFVSEQFLGAFMESGLISDPYHPSYGYPSPPFRAFRLDSRDKRTAGHTFDKPASETIPYRINGRLIFFGDLQRRLSFDILAV